MPRYTLVRSIAVGGLLAGALAGCQLLTGDCVSLGVFGVHVTPVDAQTGEPVAGATMTLTDGSYSETSSLAESPNPARGMFGAPERPGTYLVTVAAPGYQTWSRSDVVVRRGGHCDYLRPVALTARLTRTASASRYAPPRR